ncbi:MAG: proteasome accessory factor PafA2 [Bifidobacteriaceae bacterium]|jgi:proteasome accessory factor A|nr:proteasome accessory factor PafA2 [Bifidobacteriaceae bacterium]
MPRQPRSPAPVPPGPVIGIETEYGVLGAIRNPVQLSSLVVAAYKASQEGMVAPWDYGSEDPLNDARGFRLDRASAHPSQLTDRPGAGPKAGARPAKAVAARERGGPGAAMLANGARLYVDHAHPEYATPEVASAREAALWDKAGQRVMEAAARALARDGVPAALYKNNTDGQGASYGTHENYLVPRALDWDRLVAGITPFLVTRQIYTGSGRVGLGQRSQRPGFQLSQRADFVEAEVGLETTLNRPIVNTRDEPHADPARWRRLHVIVGDATMMEVATYLRLGVTALVLRALAGASAHDADRLRERTALAAPVAAFGQVSRDLSLGARLELKAGGAAAALAIQRRYLEFAARALAGGGGASEAADLLSRWAGVLDGLEADPAGVARQVEWVAKLQVLEAMRQRGGLGWDAPKLRAADLRWTEVDPATSLFAKLEAAGGVERLFSQDQVEWAVSHPPRSTRAYLKGEALRRFPDGVAAAGWDRLTLAWPGGSASYRLADPLAGAQARVGRALAAADSPQDLAARLAAEL